MCARQRTHFLLASRMRRHFAARRAHCVARAGRESRKLAFGSNSARLFIRPTLRYSTPHDGLKNHTRHRFARRNLGQNQAAALVFIAQAAMNSIAVR